MFLKRTIRWISILLAVVLIYTLTTISRASSMTIGTDDFDDEAFYVTQANSIDVFNEILAAFSASTYSLDGETRLYPECYGGARIDKKTGELIVLLTEDSIENQEYISNLVANKSVNYQKCSVSYNQILSGYDAIIEKAEYLRNLGIVIDGAGDDLVNGKVVVSVKDLNAEKIKVIQDVVDCDILSFENSQGTVKEANVSVGGGSAITSLNNNTTSTLCFAAKRGSTKGFVIAGHAGDIVDEQFTYNGTDIGTVEKTAYHNGTTADAAFVAASNNVVPVPTLVSGDVIVSATTEQLPEGTRVYMYGRVTELTSGYITDTNALVLYDDFIMVTDCYKADYESEPGDSGAPVMVYEGGFNGISHYSLCGIHSGTGPLGGKVVSPYSNIVDELGITCITGS